MDCIVNGQANGDVASLLLDHGFDVGALRPYKGDDGRNYITRFNANTGKKEKVLTNATATLLRDEWKYIDDAVARVAAPRLRAVADVMGRGLTLNIPNGMGKTVVESANMGDISQATISMDGLADSPRDRPVGGITNLPLPIIHKDFSFTARQIAVSRNGRMPLDTTTAELAARRVAEGAEQLLLGVGPTYQYGGGMVYGLTNFPGRLTKVLSSPLVGGWTPRTLLLEIIAMREQAAMARHPGPYILYVSQRWDAFLDDDYSEAKGDNTLRQRILELEGIDDVVTLDNLNGFDILLVQMTSDVVRMVNGMDITTVQWETHGGMMQHFKVMCILVPQVRGDFNGNTGIVHGAVAGQTAGPADRVIVTGYNP